MSYEDFIASKFSRTPPSGFECSAGWEYLFPFQRDLTRWALRRGKAAIFADTGLGKTRMEAAFADAVQRHTGGRVLILTPLAVAAQTVREGEAIGVPIRRAIEASDVKDTGIFVANYDRLHHFASMRFDGVVLDESSILKDFTSSTRNQLIERFRTTPYKLACSATPAPNDFTELGNHSEFLGVLPRVEMLSMWFVHDGGNTQDWRLKGHAERSFWQWVSSWAAVVRKPSDLGYDDGAYDLPPLRMHSIMVDAMASRGSLFVTDAKTLQEQRAARKATLHARVDKIAELVNSSLDYWIVWCDLNDEADACEAAIPGAVQIAGSDKAEDKEARMLAFSRGEIRALVTKPSIAGFGMNWQHANKMTFFPSHSFEDVYQAIRRCWRFGQKRPVDVYVVGSPADRSTLENMRAKTERNATMASETMHYMRDLVRQSVKSAVRETRVYGASKELVLPQWWKEVA